MRICHRVSTRGMAQLLVVGRSSGVRLDAVARIRAGGRSPVWQLRMLLREDLGGVGGEHRATWAPAKNRPAPAPGSSPA